MHKDKKRKIIITLGGVGAVATPSGIAIAEMVKNSKEVNVPQTIQDQIDKLKEDKVNKEVVIALIQQLENYIKDPKNSSNTTIVLAMIGALKQSLQIK